jgi:dipeptidyl aminopeptidase/acylaminoacyl peptidase
MTPIGAPILMVHGLADDVVPISGSRLVRDRLCAAGDPVTLDELEGFDHVLTILGRGRVDVIVDWVAARFAGEAVTDDCPT